MKNKKIMILSLVVMISILGILYLPSQSIPKKQSEIHASYLGFSNMQEMVEASELIIVGTVEKIASTGENKFPYTEFEVSISQILKKPQGFEEQTVFVRQMGIETETEIVSVKTNPLLKPGEKVILFLGPGLDKNGEFLNHYGFGGPIGRYHVRDDKVLSLHEAFPSNNNLFDHPEFVVNEDLSSFSERIIKMAEEK